MAGEPNRGDDFVQTKFLGKEGSTMHPNVSFALGYRPAKQLPYLGEKEFGRTERRENVGGKDGGWIRKSCVNIEQ